MRVLHFNSEAWLRKSDVVECLTSSGTDDFMTFEDNMNVQMYQEYIARETAAKCPQAAWKKIIF